MTDIDLAVILVLKIFDNCFLLSENIQNNPTSSNLLILVPTHPQSIK